MSDKNYASLNTLKTFLDNLKDLFTTLDLVYPLGSIYISTDNTSPEALFGGTWELIDKEFKYQGEINLVDVVTLKNNCSAVTGVLYHSGHVICMNGEFTPAIDITDSALSMFTINAELIGLTSFYPVVNHTYFSDDGQVVLSFRINEEGSFSTRDVLVRGSAEPLLPVGHSPTFETKIVIPHEYMLDSFCDKFYWKRIG